MSTKPRLDKAIAYANSNPRMQQFGQSNDNYVWDGKTACTHTICQFLALLWKKKAYTLNQVNSLAGMPVNARDSAGRPRGMNNTELARFFSRVGLPYSIKYGLTFEQLLVASNRGPVFYAMRYGSAPDWRGKAGADGIPNGYAIHNGRTQFSGFENGRHAVLLLGYLPVRNSAGTIIAYRAYRKEPNHGSPARPERPPFDTITTGQAKTEYLHYKSILGNALYAAIPTVNLPTP